MIVLGVDPGSAHVGWAVLESGGPAHVVSGSHEGLPTRDVIARLRGAVRTRRVGLVAVERVEQVNARGGFGSQMATGLLLGHGVGQRIAQALEDDGVRVVEVTAEAWHLAYFNARAVDGPAVAALVQTRILGWPAVSNAHERDAAAIALWALEAA